MMQFKRALFRVGILLAAMLFCFCLRVGAVSAVQPTETSDLPGQALWQPYLEEAPVSAQTFAQDPLGALRSLLPESPLELLAEAIRKDADVLLFLLLLTVLTFLVGETADGGLLELAAAGGCGVLLWDDLMTLAQTLCDNMLSWKQFLLGFLPVYAGVLTAGGEGNAGAAASGFLLTGLCLLAQLTVLWVQPFLQCYLALSMACCISTQNGLSEVCRAAGRLLRSGILWAGKLFAALLGLQRVVTLQLDRTTSRLGQLLTGSVPVIGQALSGAADVVLSGMQLLKSGLGLAALAILGSEFFPLYLGFLVQLALFSGCGLLCGLTENKRCEALFSCFAEAVRCMAAVTALFFALTVFGVGLMLSVGGG